MTPSKKKPKYAGRPACFGNWKLLIPSFLRSWCNVQKKKKKKKQVYGGFSGKGMRILQVIGWKSYHIVLLQAMILYMPRSDICFIIRWGEEEVSLQMCFQQHASVLELQFCGGLSTLSRCNLSIQIRTCHVIRLKFFSYVLANYWRAHWHTAWRAASTFL